MLPATTLQSHQTAGAAPARDVEAPSRWVACAAGLCAVHCLVSPLLATVAPFLALGESAEWFLLGATLVLAALLIGIGPKNGRLPVVSLVAAGGAIWAASLAGIFEPVPETVTSPLGSLVLAAGMLWSARLCRSGACEAPASDEGPSAPTLSPRGTNSAR